MQLKKHRKYLSRDMNWRGVIVALVLLALIAVEFAILGSTAASYVVVAVIVVVMGIVLRVTAHRRAGHH